MIVRAISTIGMQKSDDIKLLDISDIKYKLGLGFSTLSYMNFHKDGLRLLDGFNRLDASEKGFLSYWYGMTLAKVVAEVHMNIPWLQHVDNLIKSGTLVHPPES